MHQNSNAAGQQTGQHWAIRYFIPVSVICILFASLLFGQIFRQTAVGNLVSLASFSNTHLAHMIYRDIWPRYQDYFVRPDQGEKSAGSATFRQLRSDIVEQIRQTPVTGVRLFDNKGRELFAYGTVEQEKNTVNRHVAEALKGQEQTFLQQRERSSSALQTILVSYIPVYAGDSQQKIIGIIEVDSDPGDLYVHILEYRNLIVAITLVVLFMIFFLVLFFVRKSERSVYSQRQADRAENEERVRHVAFHDGLTGLPNRELFCYRLTSAIAQAKRTESLLAILSIDLDRFKQINDGYGHDVGDQLLKEVSLRLAECVRVSDTVARQGGDDFTILLEGINHVDEVTQIADRIIGSVAQPVEINGREVYTSASIGITVYPFDDVEAEHLLKDAETAMSASKQSGRNNYLFFSEDMHRANADQLVLEQKLRKALSEDEYLLQFQPVVDVVAGKMIGVEALLRWQNSEYGIVSPVKFIPILEESGVMSIVGEWVMKTACQKVKSWHDSGYEKITMAVNISVVQFRQRNFVETVRVALEESGLDPRYLKLELTESMLMDQSDVAIQKLNAVRGMGVHIEADDFGTGYSSLSYLKKLPIDVLKIDRSFVMDVDKSSDSAAIVTAISALAHSLKLMVIAEGVETMGELKFLSALNCHLIQGFLLSKPLPEVELMKILQQPDYFRHLLEDIKDRQAS